MTKIQANKLGPSFVKFLGQHEGQPVNWEDPIVAAANTDTGMRRSNNQDSYAIVQAASAEKWRKHGHVFMVADGMGAHAVGELASKMACENIPHNYTKSRNIEPAEALTRAYAEVGALIHGKASANRDFQGMGTTCSTLLLLPAGALIAHVGDSRIYRIRDDKIEQLTFDHSLVWELVRHKHLTPEQAQKFYPRNVITRSLGPEPTVEVDIEGPYPVKLGDVFLLCSDGLSGPVLDPEMGTIAAQFHPEQACRYLIHLANLRGGQDNITTVVARAGAWHEPGTSGPQATPLSESRGGRGGGFRIGSILASIQRRPAKTATVEENIYQSSDCALGDPLIHRLSEDTRNAQSLAIEQSWLLDWPKFAQLRRHSEEARAAGDLRGALQHLGEAITMLGIAGRLFRKDHGSNNGSHRSTAGK